MPKAAVATKRMGRHPTLAVENFGPIVSANVHFGDLTVLVGPQASGKSIFLQLFKLLVDTKQIKNQFEMVGVDWQGNFDSFMDVYFGEGMRSLWKQATSRVTLNGQKALLRELIESPAKSRKKSMLFIPAQRVMALRNGWPQAFDYHDSGVPFALREFSEDLRNVVQQFGSDGTLFPAPEFLNDDFKNLIRNHIFHGFNLKVDTTFAQKRLVLSAGANSMPLPFSVWSAGQREFVPLMLGLYRMFFPAANTAGIKWVIAEEPEMGLHPRAISVVLLMLFELMSRGYKVCISTHSSQVLDSLWALRYLSQNKASPQALLSVFDAPETPSMVSLAESVMKKSVKVYYFDREPGGVTDISKLDPGSENMGESSWGGLGEFSGRANEAVARAVAHTERKRWRATKA